MAFVQERQANYPAAIAADRKAIGALQRLIADEPANRLLQSHLAEVQNNLGDACAQSGNVTEAEASFRQAIHLYEAIFQQDPENSGWRSRLVATWINLAHVLRQQGREQEASDALSKTNALSRSITTARRS